MSEKICCKIIAPFRIGGVLFDNVGEIYNASPSVFAKLSEAKCLVKTQDPQAEEAKNDEQKQAKQRSFYDSKKKRTSSKR